MSRLRRFSVALFAAAVIGSSAPAQAGSILGGQLYTSGGTLEFEILPSRPDVAAVQFYVRVGKVHRFIASGDFTGKTVTVTDLPAGEAVFEMVVENGTTFRNGPGSRNPDGERHATVELVNGADPFYKVHFEETPTPTEPDYNDHGFSVRGAVTARPPIVDSFQVSPRNVPQTGGTINLNVELAPGTAANSVVASFRQDGIETNVALTSPFGDPDTFTGTHTLVANTSGKDFDMAVAFLIDIGDEEPLTMDGGSVRQPASVGGKWALHDERGRELHPHRPLKFKTTRRGAFSERRLTLSNTGVEVLEATLKVTGTGFSLANAPAGTAPFKVRIPAGAERELILRFAPRSNGKSKGTFDATTSDPKTPRVIVRLQGNTRRRP